jgi:thiol-disulfide isomerase/thioredoxin
MRFVFLSLFLLLLVAGCLGSSPAEYTFRDTTDIAPAQIRSFQSIPDAEVCLEDGKPLILSFSTTTCPHCRWINDTYNGVMKEYLDKGLITARHWKADIGDEQFSEERESAVFERDVAVFEQFNPDFSVPTYVFGCKYYRIGNAYELEDDLDAEAGEFKAVIEQLLAETGH